MMMLNDVDHSSLAVNLDLEQNCLQRAFWGQLDSSRTNIGELNSQM